VWHVDETVQRPADATCQVFRPAGLEPWQHLCALCQKLLGPVLVVCCHDAMIGCVIDAMMHTGRYLGGDHVGGCTREGPCGQPQQHSRASNDWRPGGCRSSDRAAAAAARSFPHISGYMVQAERPPACPGCAVDVTGVKPTTASLVLCGAPR
jgi:hypothetical protein